MRVGFQLGVDLGTTFTAAAIARDGRCEMFPLESNSPVMPSVVFLRADGELVVGEAAIRRSLREPTHVAAEFKRRLGDPAPLVLDGAPFSPEALMARLLEEVVDLAVEREGGRPEVVVLTHPANYGPYKLDVMREVERQAGLHLDMVRFISEPRAAALSYAGRNRVEPHEVVAVYDFGGGTFDVALLRSDGEDFQLVGEPGGIDRLGGIDIDAAVVYFVDDQLGGRISELDATDDASKIALNLLLRECRAAKEALSTDIDTVVTVSMPELQTTVRVTRADLERMVNSPIRATIKNLRTVVERAGLAFDDVSRILLVGGSSRIPLVTQMLHAETGRPIALDAHPKMSTALGAAQAGIGDGNLALTEPPEAPVSDPSRSIVDTSPPARPPSQHKPASPAPEAPRPSPKHPRRSPRLIVATAALLLVVALVIGLVLVTRDNNQRDDTADTIATTTSPSSSAAPVVSPIHVLDGSITDLDHSLERFVRVVGDDSQVVSSTTEAVLATMHGHTADISAQRFTPDGTGLLTSSVDGTARLWDTASGAQIWSVTPGFGTAVIQDVKAGAGLVVVSSANVSKANVYELATGNPRASVDLGANNQVFRTALLSQDGRHLLTASSDARTQVWDLATSQPILTIHGDVLFASFSPDESMIATFDQNEGVGTTWNATNGHQVVRIASQTPQSPFSFTPDGTALLSAETDGNIHLRTANDARSILSTAGTSAFVSDDGILLAVGRDDGTGSIINVADGHTIEQLSSATSEILVPQRFSDDHTELATFVTADRAAVSTASQIWNTAP